MGEEIDLKKLDDWYTEHFEELVEKYAGKAVAVINGQVVEVGESELQVDRRAREQHPGQTPLVVTVPTQEELVCLLFA
jgi:hypothetical protein